MSDRRAAAVTRVAAGDDAAVAGGRYDGLAMTLHWLTALLVLTLLRRMLPNSRAVKAH